MSWAFLRLRLRLWYLKLSMLPITIRIVLKHWLIYRRESVITAWCTAFGIPLYVRCFRRFDSLFAACYRPATHTDFFHPNTPGRMPIYCAHHAKENDARHEVGALLRDDVCEDVTRRVVQ